MASPSNGQKHSLAWRNILILFRFQKFNEKKVQQQCDQQFFSTPSQSIHDIFSFSLHSKEGERRQKRHFVFSANLFINFWCCCSFCCCCDCCCEQRKNSSALKYSQQMKNFVNCQLDWNRGRSFFSPVKVIN